MISKIKEYLIAFRDSISTVWFNIKVFLFRSHSRDELPIIIFRFADDYTPSIEQANQFMRYLKNVGVTYSYRVVLAPASKFDVTVQGTQEQADNVRFYRLEQRVFEGFLTRSHTDENAKVDLANFRAVRAAIRKAKDAHLASFYKALRR